VALAYVVCSQSEKVGGETIAVCKRKKCFEELGGEGARVSIIVMQSTANIK
jgi:hypothetical protein